MLLSVACLAILCCLLLVPPYLGMADNGDYARIMVFHGLTHSAKEWGDRYFAFFDTSYVFDQAESLRYASPDFVSSALIFSGIAVRINALLGNTGFNLLMLGAVNCLVFALAAFWISSATRRFQGTFRMVAMAFGVVAFTDIAYVAYLNSFYGESASLLFFLLMAAAAFQVTAAKSRHVLWIAVFIAAAAGLLLAKYQNLLLLPFLLAFAWRAFGRYAGKAASRQFLLAALVLCYFGYRFWLSSPAAVGDAVLYNSVFNGILVNSPSQQEDLKELGLNPDWVSYTGSSAFQSTSLRFKPEFAGQFLKNVNVGSIFRFYLKHPVRLWLAMQRGIEYSFRVRPAESGNYEKSAGKQQGAKSYSWAMWSTARIAALPKSLWFLWALVALYLGVLIREWRRDPAPERRLAVEFGLMIPAMALQQLVLISITDGVGDLVKHGFFFNLMVDVMLVIVLAYACSMWMSRRLRPKPLPIPSKLETAK